MSADWVVVRRCTSMHEAVLLRSVLESEGIPCALPDEHTLGVHPGLTFLAGGVRVLVPAAEAERAEDLLAGVEADQEPGPG